MSILEIFKDNEDLNDLFKNKGINKKHNVEVFRLMTKEE